MNTLQETYAELHREVLIPLASRLELHLRQQFSSTSRIDRIVARAKSINRFLDKAKKTQNESPKYNNPLSQIQDQIGARIIAFYLKDVEEISNQVERYYRKIESRMIVPDSEAEFGYFGKHFVLFLPSDLFDDAIPAEAAPKFFELQVKTLFQHAWAEANHDLAYKPVEHLSSDHRRQIAFTAAQSWGADKIFNDLVSQLGHRKEK